MSTERVDAYAEAVLGIARAEGHVEEIEDELFRFARAVRDIGDHGRMQGIDAALTAGFRQWAECRKRRIRLAPALLRPSHQQGFQ